MSSLIGTLFIVGSALVSPTTYIPVAEAFEPEPQSIEALISHVALEEKISSTTLFNLAWSESRLDPLADNGHDRGLVQISRKYHAEVEDSCAFDAGCSLRWAAQRIKSGYLYEWTAGNCYSYVSLFVKLPRMAEIKGNSTPAVGRVAIFQYGKLKHIALITKLNANSFTVREANFKPALIGTREVKYTDPRITGFWSP